MTETERWFGYTTNREGHGKRVFADVPKGEHALEYISPLVPKGYRLQAFGPAEPERMSNRLEEES